VYFTWSLQEDWKWRKPCSSKGVLHFEKNTHLHSTPIYESTHDHNTYGILCFGGHETTKTQKQYMQALQTDMIQDPCINRKYA